VFPLKSPEGEAVRSLLINTVKLGNHLLWFFCFFK